MKIPERKPTREVRVGKTAIGGRNPVLVQSMTSTDTSDVKATLAQIRRLVNAGCEMVRVAVPGREALKALPLIKAKTPVPLVADIHFNFALAFAAMEAGCDKIRINPGNIGGMERFKSVIMKAKDKGAAVRIGVNSGSVEKDLLEKHGGPTPSAMVESALRYVEQAEKLKFDRIVVSIKSSSPLDSLEANCALSKAMNYPIHLGITEAGSPGYGAIKSAVGLGALLLDGIGDTIRVSLTGDPVREIPAAYDILKASGARIVTPEVISCPTCGRLQYNMEKAAAGIEKRLRAVKKPARVAIMGCTVNGPGEAKEADVALCGAGKGEAVLYVKGARVRKVKDREMVNAVIKAVMEL